MLYDGKKDKVLKFYSPVPTGIAYSEESLYLYEKPELDVSIIVPCYNVEKYVKECVDSICAQKTKYSFEVLLINDGSLDNTFSLLKEYEKYPIVKVISQENKGLAGARNSGIKISKGEYLIFIDSDDYISENYIEMLVDTAKTNDADLVACSYYVFNEKGNLKHRLPKNKKDKAYINGLAWGKVYKRELFSHIQYPEKYLFEDTITMHLIWPQVKNFCTIDTCNYYYRINNSSIVHSLNNNPRTIETLYITDLMVKTRQRLFGEESIRSNEYYDLLINQFYLNQQRVKGLPKNIQKEVFLNQAKFVQEEFSSYKSNKELFEKSLRQNNFILCNYILKTEKIHKLISRIIKH